MPENARITVTVYDPVWKTFHWLTVALVLALLALGWMMSGGRLFQWHASLGLLLLLLTALRLFWRSRHVAPPVPPTLRPWEVRVLKLVQLLFYVFLFLQPLVGWALYSLSSKGTLFFGLFPLPKLFVLPPGTGVSTARVVLEGLHGLGATMLTVLFVLHAGAALKHHFILRDTVLLRMAPAFLGAGLRRLRGETAED